MARWQFTKGLHDIGNGHYAYLLPDGSWGWSNAGLIADGGHSLLVDTLFDLKLTGEMLERMRAAVPAARRIGTLVNTHANGDHYFGNQLVTGAEIIASEACLRDMLQRPPETFLEMMRSWRASGRPGGAFMHEMMGSRFDFSGIVFTPPTRTFESALTLHVGGKRVELVNVGPAHTSGDVLVHVPEDRVVYTGDILFVGGHAPAWAGPVGNWIKACDLMLSWDPEVVVPGHGPITDKSGIRRMKRYFEYLTGEARRCFDAGLDVAEAARSISLAEFEDWNEAERVVVNIDCLYREFAGRPDWGNREFLNDLMAQYHHEHRPAQGH
jgi:cyclase